MSGIKVSNDCARIRLNVIAAVVLVALLILPVPVLSGPAEARPRGDTFPPTVLWTFPDDNSGAVPRDTPIVIKFNESMNQSATEAAFTITPSISGTFFWNATGDEMTFAPDANLSDLTNYKFAFDCDVACDLAGNKLVENDAILEWRDKADMPTPRNSLTSTSFGGKIYAIGGYAGGRKFTVEEYNPGNDSWVTRTSMPIGAYRLGSSTIGDRIYVAGGYYPAGNYPAQVQIFDVTNDTWSLGSSMSVGRDGPGVAAWNDTLYVFGGESGFFPYDLTSAEAYFPHNNSWMSISDMPTDYRDLRAVTVGDRIYLAGGDWGTLDAQGSYLIYDPINDTYEYGSSFPLKRLYIGLEAIGDKIYYIGGWDPETWDPVNRVDIYNITTDTWSLGDPLDIAMDDFGTAVCQDRIFVQGGNDVSLGTIQVNDAYGEWKQYVFNFTVGDFTPPATNIGPIPSPVETPIFPVEASAWDASGVTQVQLWYRKDGGAWTLYEADAAAPYEWYFDWSLTGGEGVYELAALGNDTKGNQRALPAGNDTWTRVRMRPKALSVSPAPDSIQVSVADDIVVRFSEPMNQTATEAAFSIDPPVAGSISWNVSGDEMTFTPAAALAQETIYDVSLDCSLAKGLDGDLLQGNADMLSSEWSWRYPVTENRSAISVAAVGDYLYAISGRGATFTNTVERYDPSTGNWTTMSPIPTPRMYASTAVVDGNIYVIGGQINGQSYSTVNEVYYPHNDTWAAMTPMPTARREAGCTVFDGQIYVIGGYTGTGSDYVEAYDPATDTWEAKAPLPDRRFRLSAATVGDRIYAGGGWYNGVAGPYDDLYEYYPYEDRWTQLPDMPRTRGSSAWAELGGKIMMMGGHQTAGSYISIVDVYEPSLGSWSTAPDIQHPRDFPGAAILHDHIYLMGGWDTTRRGYNERYDAAFSFYNWTFRTFDPNPPVTSVDTLPSVTYAYQFEVNATAIDGCGVKYVELWYSKDGGAWTKMGNSYSEPWQWTVAINATGGEGIYEFYTRGTDNSGLYEAAPAGNDTWTRVMIPPKVSMVTPPQSSTDQSLKANIVVTFDREMNTASAESGFSITPVVPGSFSWDADNRTMTYDPTGLLLDNTTYNCTIDASVARDANGTYLDGDGNIAPEGSPADDFSWNFTTGVLEPKVYSTDPASDETLVDPATNLTVAFDKPMNVSAVEASFSVSGSVTGNFSWSGDNQTMTFDPDAPLAEATVNVSMDCAIAEDAAGNPLSGNEHVVSDQWVRKTDPSYQHYHGGATAYDGRIWVFAGESESTALEIYDPDINSWEYRPIPAKNRNTAFTVGDRIYLLWNVGNPTKLDMYDPVNDTWSSKAPLNVARNYAGSAELDGKLYAVGGWTTQVEDVVEVYDPANDTWSTLTPMGSTRRAPAAAGHDGKLYVFGGYSGANLNTGEVYDPANDTWTGIAPFPGPGRSWATAVTVGDLIYLIGGSTSFVTQTVYAYDPIANTWSDPADLVVGVSHIQAATHDGNIYVVGGMDASFTYVKVNQVYRQTYGYYNWSFTINDSTPPVFAGLANAADEGSGGNVTLAWNAAVDPLEPITYNIYMAESSGSQDFSSPNYTASASPFAATGLTDGVTYHFVVRAEDAAGNEDSNSVEMNATPSKIIEIGPGELMFDPDPGRNGTEVNVSAYVENHGYADVTNLLVEFYLGEPDTDHNGVPDPSAVSIGNCTVDVAAGDVVLASVSWTANGTGNHTLFVWVDPLDAVVEQDESNNTANGTVRIHDWCDTFWDTSNTSWLGNVLVGGGNATAIIVEDDFEDGSLLDTWSINQGTQSSIQADPANASNSCLRMISTSTPGEDIQQVIHEMGNAVTGNISIRFYDDMDGTKGFAAGVYQPTTYYIFLSVHTSIDSNDYLIRDDSGGFVNSGVARSAGWHTARFDISETDGTKVYIDGTYTGVDNANLLNVTKIVFTLTWSLYTTCYFDDVVLSPPGGAHLVSEVITLPADKDWNTLFVNKTEGNGTVSVTILDGTTGIPVSGYGNLTGQVIDISGISHSSHSSLKLSADFSGPANESAVLHHWAVDYTSRDIVPPAISNVSATSINETSATITWDTDDDSDSLVNYSVNPDLSSNVTVSNSSMVKGHSITLVGLEPGTTYYYLVRSADLVGNSAQDDNASAYFQFTTLPDTAPPIFGGLTGATDDGNGGNVTLTWGAATDLSPPITFNVYMAESSGSQDFSAPNFTAAASPFQVSGLANAQTYFFVVRAEDVAGNEDTNTVEMNATPTTAIDATPPGFGGLVSAADGGSANVTLGWNAATDPDTPECNSDPSTPITYNIYVALTSGSQDLGAPNHTTTDTSLEINGLTLGQTYYYIVRAEDSAGNEDGNLVELNVTPADNTPPTFAGVTGASDDGTGGNVTLTWNPASDVSGPIVYNIYIAESTGSQDFTAPNHTAPSSPYQVTGLTDVFTYWFVVRAEDSFGNEDTNAVEMWAMPTTPVDGTPPVFGGITGAVDGGDANVTISWAPATDPDTAVCNSDPSLPITYNIYIAASSGGQNFAVPDMTTQDTSLEILGLTLGQAYYFVVRAEDSTGNEDGNAIELSATPTDGTPPDFAGLQSTSDELIGGAVNLSWLPATDNSGSVTYLIYVEDQPGLQDFAVPDHATENTSILISTWEEGDLENYVAYYFVVRARDAEGNVDANTIELSVTPTDGTPPTFSGIQSTVSTGVGGEVNVSWTTAVDPSMPIIYYVYRSKISGFAPSTDNLLVTSANLYYLDQGLENGVPYYYVVRARDSATIPNMDQNVVELGVIPQDLTPPAFDGIDTVQDLGTGGRVNITWNASSDSNLDASIPWRVRYDIYVWNTLPGNLIAGNLARTWHVATGLTNGLDCDFIVVAKDYEGNVNVSGPVNCTPHDTEPPVFQGLNTTYDMNADGSVFMDWLAATDNDTDPAAGITYNIYWALTSGSQDLSAPNLTSSGPDEVVTGLVNGQTCYFVVRAEDASGNEEANLVEFSAVPTTPWDATPPVFAGISSAENAPTLGNVTLTWGTATDPDDPGCTNDPSLPILYHVFYSTTPGGQDFVGAHYSTPGNSMELGGFTLNTIYYFVVRAEDAAGNMESNVVELSVTIMDDVPPGSTLDPLDAFSVSRDIYLFTSAQDNVGVSHVEVWYRANGGAWARWGGDHAPGPILFSAPADGSFDFDTVAVDVNGNREKAALTPRETVDIDTIPPTIASATPASGENVTDRNVSVTIRFSEPMDTSALSGSLTISANIAYTTTWDASGRNLTITPNEPWPVGEVTIFVSNSMTDLAGNPLPDSYAWSFYVTKTESDADANDAAEDKTDQTDELADSTSESGDAQAPGDGGGFPVILILIIIIIAAAAAGAALTLKRLNRTKGPGKDKEGPQA